MTFTSGEIMIALSLLNTFGIGSAVVWFLKWIMRVELRLAHIEHANNITKPSDL